MFSLIRTVAPTEYPVSLARAKEHLRISGDDEDGILEAYLSGAIAAAQRESGLSFCLATFRLVMDDFPRGVGRGGRSGEIRLPVGPVYSVQSVNYLDTAGAAQVVSVNDYNVGRYTWRVAPTLGKFWPATNQALENAYVEYRAGWGTPEDVPDDAKAAILLILGDRYENRGDGVGTDDRAIPAAALRLLRNLHCTDY